MNRTTDERVTHDKQVPTIGIIRVITTEDIVFLETHARLISEYLPGIAIEYVTECIREFPDGIPNEAEEKRAIPFVIETGISLVEKQDADSLFVSCAADPGVRELRKEVDVPVIGAGSASASIALLLGNRVAVLGIDEKPPAIVKKTLGKSFAGYAKPVSVKTTHDISGNLDKYIDISRDMVSDMNADALLLACTGLSTARIAPILEDALGIPVIDAVLVSGLVAYYAARQTALRGR
jgi:allantoin racemase